VRYYMVKWKNGTLDPQILQRTQKYKHYSQKYNHFLMNL
jgi:hypothetical protein